MRMQPIPCKKCHQDILVIAPVDDGKMPVSIVAYEVKCPNCFTVGPRKDERDDAITAWNESNRES